MEQESEKLHAYPLGVVSSPFHRRYNRFNYLGVNLDSLV